MFDFDEFRKKLEVTNYDESLHYAFKRTEAKDGLFLFFEFRIYCWEGPDHLLIYERLFSCITYEDEKIKSFSDSCKAQAAQVSATPGTYEEGK